MRQGGDGSLAHAGIDRGAHDYINFMIAAQRTFSCTEAARCQPTEDKAAPHDAFTRLLTRQPLDTGALWRETQEMVDLDGGLLVLDDSTLDKSYAKRIELVTRHWSGKHHSVVIGINLISQVRSARGQINHIGFSLRTFVRLEAYRLRTGVSWYEAKTAIIRASIRQYPQNPLYILNSTA